VARLSVLRADVILDPDLTTSLIIELIGMPQDRATRPK